MFFWKKIDKPSNGSDSQWSNYEGKPELPFASWKRHYDLKPTQALAPALFMSLYL